MTVDDRLGGLTRPAFEQAIDEHGPAIHAYLARRTEPGTAEDLLGEVWLAAYSARESFDPGLGPVRGWLFGIARHVLHGYYRRHQLRTRFARLFGADRPVDESDAIDARLDAAALAPRLREALAALSTADRELLLLIAWEQLTPTEAAQVLGIPAGTARSRLHRARRQMDERLSASLQVPTETTRQEADR